MDIQSIIKLEPDDIKKIDQKALTNTANLVEYVEELCTRAYKLGRTFERNIGIN